MFPPFSNCSFLKYIIANKCSDCNTKCVSFGWIFQGNLHKSELMFENGQNMKKYKKDVARMVGGLPSFFVEGRNPPNIARIWIHFVTTYIYRRAFLWILRLLLQLSLLGSHVIWQVFPMEKTIRKRSNRHGNGI